MRGPALLVFSCAALASSVTIVACSLAVDTSGLSGAAVAVESGDETSILDGGGATDGPTEGDSTPDAGFACDGGTRVTAFDGFTAGDFVTIQGGILTASVSTTAPNQQFGAIARSDFKSVPSRVLLTYDLGLTRNDQVYFEPGCSLYLQDTQSTIFRQTFAANKAGFAQYLNHSLADGGDESKSSDGVPLPNGDSSRHIEVALTLSGLNLAADVSVDGALERDQLLLSSTPSVFVVRCGIAYGEQTSPGAATTTVTIRSFSLSLCP